MERTDLAAIEELCRLQLAARRLGCRILVHDTNPSLRELIERVGLADVLLHDERPSSDDGTEPDVPS